MRLLAVAGELSGDAHGGALLAGLRYRLPDLEVRGIGGPRMLAAGLQPLFPLSALQVHGLLEVVGQLPRLYRTLWALERELDTHRPDGLLTIDYPGFNLKLARAAKRRGIPVYHYCSPQVWAWRRGRIRTIAEVVDLIFVLFPFEAPLYERVGLEAAFLGHPLVGRQADDAEVAALRAKLAAPEGVPVVAVMPGSRPSELRRHLDVLLGAIRLNGAAGFRARYVLPVAPSLDRAEVEARVRAAGVDVQVLEDAFLPLLRLADLAIVASGTATLQTAMASVPFLVIYRVAPLSFFLARRFAYLQHLSIVNILAGREVVPELLQGDFTPERVSEAFLALARDGKRQAVMRQTLGEIAAQLGEPGAYDRAAALLAERLIARTAVAPAGAAAAGNVGHSAPVAQDPSTGA
ncbi:MAG TPA: lipid-A-disaccharide synthase [bacterium]|nr:lipid-A-disaccharide synthase [bacterium]